MEQQINELGTSEAPEVSIPAQFGRVKGASWFPLLYDKDVIVIGQGGIGSWVSLLLSRIGCKLYTFDMDTFEEHNMTGQIIRKKDIGKSKVDAIAQIIEEMSPECIIDTHNYAYTEESFTGNIVICGLDNMAARKVAFTNWIKYLSDVEDRSKCFFQDGRLTAEQLQIFNIPGDKPALIQEYYNKHLFPDKDLVEGDCTFKQTSHCAAMIASHMVGFLTNWVSGLPRKVPFFHEYFIPINYTRNDES